MSRQKTGLLDAKHRENMEWKLEFLYCLLVGHDIRSASTNTKTIPTAGFIDSQPSRNLFSQLQIFAASTPCIICTDSNYRYAIGFNGFLSKGYRTSCNLLLYIFSLLELEISSKTDRLCMSETELIERLHSPMFQQ